MRSKSARYMPVREYRVRVVRDAPLRRPASLLRLDRLRLVGQAERADGRLEVVERVEGLVDAGEAQVRDLIELPQLRQDGEADVVGLDLRRSGRADRLLHLPGEHRQVGVGDRAALAGLADAQHDLLPAERFGHAAALDHAQARGLGGREAAAALRALTAAADGEPVVTRPRVDDTGVRVAAEGAEHAAILTLSRCGTAE